MKSNVIFSTLLAAGFLAISCKKEETTETSSDTPKEIIMPSVQSIPAQTNQPVTQTVTPTQAQQPVANGQQVTMNQAPVATKKGMNPPHGQPGHRCDIPVGAPLNSPPGTNNQPKAGTAITQQITPSAVSAQTPAAQTATPAILDPNAPVTAPGMNPPHGQPGHQCGIAVGAPLPK